MDALRNPVGPKDRKVYLRRRLFVLAGLVAVVAVVVLVFLKPGSSGGARGAASVEVPADLPRETAAPDEEEEEVTAACTPEQLAVTPVTDKAEYAAGEQPQLALSVENTGTEACSADLGTASMEFTITSGDDQVWRSVDCMENPESLAVILDPGAPISSEAVPWVRERSDPETCGIAREQVAAGGASYHLMAAIGGASSRTTAQFLLY